MTTWTSLTAQRFWCDGCTKEWPVVVIYQGQIQCPRCQRECIPIGQRPER